ncbi:MAG TPA: hypothetical protein PKL84_12125, partial [Candidatus Hydrogenedentes bacterium]|nr:hypothetical protein [Candidatus Hydrogenedentota bacterium]
FANEAYGDAADPTISFGTSSGDFASEAAPSIHCFQNQTASLLEEELVLLRGRDDTRPPNVTTAPIYNRFYPNFTNDITGGQVAYFLNYGIVDVTGNGGSPDEIDAATMYPQGHGDAWGHYLMAAKSYYYLFAHPHYTYIPRSELVNVGAQAVQVDYFDERKFANIVAAKARCGAEIVNLTYRYYYTADPQGQWQGYKDTDPERAWGVSEWASRAGQGAYFDWVVGNALLPQEDVDAEPTINKIDRTTVIELREVAGAFQDIQAKVDQADLGLNPLGLARNVVPFDIDPSRIDAGETHFEQIYNRAVKAMMNAITVFNHANESSQRLRLQQDNVNQFQINAENREFDFNSRLIEIFGYPYAGDIGPSGSYPAGYDGPDWKHYSYFDPTSLLGEDPGQIQEITFELPLVSFTNVGEANVGDETINEFGVPTKAFEPVTFHLSTNGFGEVRPPGWGERRAPGEIQLARQELWLAISRYEKAIDTYEGLLMDIEDAIKLIEQQKALQATKIEILLSNQREKQDLHSYVKSAKTRQFAYRTTATNVTRVANGLAEAIPRMLVAGLAVGGDYTSVIRGVIKGIAAVSEAVLSGLADAEEINILKEEQSYAQHETQNEITLTTATQDYELQQALAQLNEKVRNETTLRFEIVQAEEAMMQQLGRYKSTLARGQRLLEELLRFRRQTASQVTQYRYRDMAFRIFRNDALQKYRAQFDLAGRYVFLAAMAYDYETNLLGSDTASGQRFLTDIVRSRSLGLIQNGLPVTAGTTGDPGLADP